MKPKIETVKSVLRAVRPVHGAFTDMYCDEKSLPAPIIANRIA